MTRDKSTTDRPESDLHPLCFKCERPSKQAVKGGFVDAWQAPWGVILRGGDNFGSLLYDSFVDPLKTGVELIVCDDCLVSNKHLLRETGIPFWGYKDHDGKIIQSTVKRLKEEVHLPMDDQWIMTRTIWLNGKYVEVDMKGDDKQSNNVLQNIKKMEERSDG